jgi:hypothetical protein
MQVSQNIFGGREAGNGEFFKPVLSMISIGKSANSSQAKLVSQTNPQRLKSFSKRGETLKMFFPAKLREKDFWLSVLAGPAGP